MKENGGGVLLLIAGGGPVVWWHGQASDRVAWHAPSPGGGAVYQEGIGAGKETFFYLYLCDMSAIRGSETIKKTFQSIYDTWALFDWSLPTCKEGQNGQNNVP